MKKKVYHLASCSTCQKIIDELGIRDSFELQNIKEENVSEKELAKMAKQEGSYEALFSRRALKYRSMGLNEKELGEDDYKKLILEEYTFLKRPVIQIGDKFFVGNAKKTVESVREGIKGLGNIG